MARCVSSIVTFLERIRARAYFIWLERIRTGEGGDALSDWLRAEAELGH